MVSAWQEDHDAARARVRELVAAGSGDPLAPFALRPDRRFVFSPDGSAAIGYAVRLKTAVAAGDPLGPIEGWQPAVDEFVRFAARRKLRLAVLGAGDAARPMWEKHGLGHLAIGRDVVLRPEEFTTEGRRFRNLRLAINRTRNAGVQVEVQREGDLTVDTVQALRAVMSKSKTDDTRGFSMIFGNLFDGQRPDSMVAVARDRHGEVVGGHRYLWAGRRDLSLDLPIRSRTAPNGVDERIIVEVVNWAARHEVERVSLAFAPFPDLFAHRDSLGPAGRVGYVLVHALDPLIRVERLYRYLRKYHAFDQERYVLLRWRQVVRVAAALLLLEFGVGRRERERRNHPA
ncbi:MAG: phosphatidylglycerol lysyltransferase domain-containing protein [Jatrophihabitans sp.]